MILALQVFPLVAIIGGCLYRAGVVRERARWVSCVRWIDDSSWHAYDPENGDGVFRTRALQAMWQVETKGWARR